MALSAQEVKEVGARLVELGIWDPKESFGKAVKDFQRGSGLKIDGIVGPKTKAALWPASIPDRQKAPKRITSAPKTMWPRQGGVSAFYGARGANQVLLQLPWKMKIAWDHSKVITRFSCNVKCHDAMLEAFTRIGKVYNEKARRDLGLDLFGGCLNVRKMRGGSSWSMHSWGIAIDFDPARNQLRWGRNKARLAKPDCEEFWEIWESVGGVSLGRTKNYDWMHVQFARV